MNTFKKVPKTRLKVFFAWKKARRGKPLELFPNTNLAAERMKESSKDPSESVFCMEKKQERQFFGTISPTPFRPIFNTHSKRTALRLYVLQSAQKPDHFWSVGPSKTPGTIHRPTDPRATDGASPDGNS